MLRRTQALVWHSSKTLPSAPWASHFNFSWKLTVMLSASVAVRRVAGQGQATVYTVTTCLDKEQCIHPPCLAVLLPVFLPMPGPPSHTPRCSRSPLLLCLVLPPTLPCLTPSSLLYPTQPPFHPCSHSDTSFSLCSHLPPGLLVLKML